MIKSGVGVAAAGVAFSLFCVGVGWLVFRLIRNNQEGVISTLPVMREQTITMTTPGEVVVIIEVPRMATDYRQWELEITEGSTRRIHNMKWGGPRTSGTVTGFSTIKIPLGRLPLASPDNITIRINGLAPDGNYSPYHIVLVRPYIVRMALQIVGLVLCSVGALLSLIWGFWLLGVVKTS